MNMQCLRKFYTIAYPILTQIDQFFQHVLHQIIQNADTSMICREICVKYRVFTPIVSPLPESC